MPREHPERRRRPYGKLFLIAGALVALVSLVLVGCKSSGTSSKNTPNATQPKTAAPTTAAFTCAPAGSATSLTGDGSTFDGPLFAKWVAVYNTACGVENNYQPTGSGQGIKDISNKTVDYAASDAIMSATQEQTAVAGGGPIMHMPVTLGGIAIVANVQGIQKGQLKLTPDVLAKIFLGQITKWNDPAITGINSALPLPSSDIAVVHRSDGSGTTFLFTDYLSKVSPNWRAGPASGTTVNWPTGVGAEKNAGVAAGVQQVAGAIGYVEATYAIQTNMAWVAVQNSSGKYIEPTLAAISAAATGVALPADMKVFVDNSPNPDAYPISGFSWALIYQNQTDQAKAQTLANYFWWGLHEGQSFSEALGYAKLPADAVTKAEAEIRSMTVNGQPVKFQ